MDRNFVRNQNEPSVWQTFFRPQRAMSVSVTQNLAGKPAFPNRCTGSETSRPRPRVNFLRLNSQGEDNRSPPIVLPSENIFHKSELYHINKEISKSTRKSNNSLFVGSSETFEWPSPQANQIQNICPASTIFEEAIQHDVFQRKSSLGLHSNNIINNVFSTECLKFARLSALVSNKYKFKSPENLIFPNSVPLLIRGLPYFRPTIPVGLSASAILFERYKQAERFIDRTNPLFMQANMSLEIKKSELSSINSSLLLAKSELAKLMNKQTIAMNRQLPQTKQVTIPEDSISALKNKISSNMKLEQISVEQLGSVNTQPLCESSVRQDNESDVINDQTETTENSSCYFTSESSDLDNVDESDASDEEEDEGEYSGSDEDSNTLGSLSDFESDTESYDASSEYESDSDLESDTESWSSDVKSMVSTCQNDLISFILGQGTDAAGGKDSGFDEGDEASIDDSKNEDQVDEDHLWHSLNASGDPYNPTSGWKCFSGSPFQSITPENRNELATKEHLNNSEHALPKIKCDVAATKPDYLISDVKSEALNNDVAPCPVIKCLISCTWSSKETNLNKTVNGANCEDTNAATVVRDVMNMAKSCIKNKLPSQQEKQPKKVSFSCNDVIAFENPEWCDEYRETRKPYWESFARDSCRFRRRIMEISNAISYCFDPNHRNLMMKKLKINN